MVHQFSCSVVSDSSRPQGLQHTRPPSPSHLLLLKLMSIEVVMPSNQIILCHPLLLLPSVFPSIRFFPNESVLHIRWPKYWSFSFSISPSNEYSGLIPIPKKGNAFLTGSWQWAGKPGVLQSMGSYGQTWLSNWPELRWLFNAEPPGKPGYNREPLEILCRYNYCLYLAGFIFCC